MIPCRREGKVGGCSLEDTVGTRLLLRSFSYGLALLLLVSFFLFLFLFFLFLAVDYLYGLEQTRFFLLGAGFMARLGSDG